MTGTCPIQQLQAFASHMRCNVGALQHLSGVRIVKINQTLKDRKVTRYLVEDVDDRLGAVSLKASDPFNRFPTREDCLDERGNLILGDCVTDQSLQGLFTRVAAWFHGHLYDISIGLSVNHRQHAATRGFANGKHQRSLHQAGGELERCTGKKTQHTTMGENAVFMDCRVLLPFSPATRTSKGPWPPWDGSEPVTFRSGNHVHRIHPISSATLLCTVKDTPRWSQNGAPGGSWHQKRSQIPWT